LAKIQTPPATDGGNVDVGAATSGYADFVLGSIPQQDVPAPFLPDTFTDYAQLSDVPGLDWLFDGFGSGLDSSFSPFSSQQHPGGTPSFNPYWQDIQVRPLHAQAPAATYETGQSDRESWVIDSQSAHNHTLELPELGEGQLSTASQGSYFQLPKTSNSERLRIEKVIENYIQRPLWSRVSIANLPSPDKLDYCIDLFFAHFHPVSKVSLSQTTESDRWYRLSHSYTNQLLIQPPRQKSCYWQ
jgi:hypothetical protein